MGNTTVKLLIGFACLVGILIVLALIAKHAEKKDNDFVVRQKSGTKNYLIWIYRFYQKTPFLKVIFYKIKDAVTKSYPADTISINKRVSQILFRITLVVIAGITGTLILAGDDHYFLIIGIFYTLILVYAYVSSTLKTLDMTILTQFEVFLGDVRNRYHQTPMIDDAIYDTIEDMDYEIGLHVTKMHDIITSPRMEEEIDGYVGSEPNQFMLMFLSVCASVKKFADRKLQDGSSVFLNNIGYLKDEVHEEIDGRRQNDLAFKGMGAIILIPALFCKPLQNYVVTHFEGTADYYSGAMNIVCLLIVFTVTFISYVVLVNLRDGVKIVEKENDIFSNLASRPGFNEILTKIVNKHYSKFKRYNDAAHGMGDHTGMKAFLLKRILLAIAGFVLSVLIITTGIITTKYKLLNDASAAYESSMTPSEEYTQAMRDVTIEYVHVYKNDKYLTDDEYKQQIRAEIITDIKETTDIKNDSCAEQIADEVIARSISYRGIYPTWWEFLIAVAVGLIGFYAPVIYLLFREKIIDSNKNAELVRFQSIALILMHMRGSTTDVILEWMEKFSYCFKDSIVECRLNMSMGEQKAIEEMKQSETHKGFRAFCDCLLAVDRVGVEKAFDAVSSDREHYLADRKTDRAIELDNKSSKASLFFMAPFATVLICELIVPITKYALTLYLQTSSI